MTVFYIHAILLVSSFLLVLMKKLNQIIILSILALGFTFAACETASNSSSSSDTSFLNQSSIDVNTSEIDSFENFTSDSFSTESNSEDSLSDSSSEEYDNGYAEIMDEAYSLSSGKTLTGSYELGGVITKIDTAYSSSKGICLYFEVDEPEHRSMYCYQLTGEGANIIQVGDYIWVSGSIKNYKGLIEFDKGCQLVDYEIHPNNIPPDLENDPYADISENEFYANYTPAISEEDAYFRSLHGFMSGELETPDQAPTISEYQPMQNGSYVRNSEMLLSSDGKTYTVVDAYGKESFQVYKSGAYITLEEVAAYVYAFGTYPANYTTSKNESPASSIWGEYLRLNHTSFSGDTSRYPYEPKLPNISGCGGNLNYYEMDIGTTGTDCDPSYTAEIYNNGYSITRGAARIVYGKNDLNKNGVYEIGEFHVFYTYNHYNDFQEYLNYEGGWGEMFGNITGGGTISSKDNYNPTDYIEVILAPLSSTATYMQRIDYFYYDTKKY